MNAYFSKLTSKSQTVIPRAVRKQLGPKPGDTVGYAMTKDGIILRKAQNKTLDDPFATFTGWSSADDEEAFKDL
jgi:antitoxin PrlF